jgi:hypothetical protein
MLLFQWLVNYQIQLNYSVDLLTKRKHLISHGSILYLYAKIKSYFTNRFIKVKKNLFTSNCSNELLSWEITIFITFLSCNIVNLLKFILIVVPFLCLISELISFIVAWNRGASSSKKVGYSVAEIWSRVNLNWN